MIVINKDGLDETDINESKRIKSDAFLILMLPVR